MFVLFNIFLKQPNTANLITDTFLVTVHKCFNETGRLVLSELLFTNPLEALNDAEVVCTGNSYVSIANISEITLWVSLYFLEVQFYIFSVEW